MHIGYIMDGNRRWAKKQGVQLIHQHKKGFENIEHILLSSIEKGVKYVSFWGLAYKNLLERSKQELDQIYQLIEQGFKDMQEVFDDHNIRVVFVGDHSLIPEKTKEILTQVEDKTRNHKETTCIIALGYGGQREITQAVKSAHADGIDLEQITESTLSNYIQTAKYPAPDMIVRTGCNGRIRHSGYFLWQSEYSEYYFTEKYWPELDETDVKDIVSTLNIAQRNFGK